jgi:hypothetical protein
MKNYLIIMLLIVSFVAAENVYRLPLTETPAKSIYLYNFPVWAEVGETTRITSTNVNTAIDNTAEIIIAGSAGSMNYDSTNNRFYADIISGSEEDVNFSIEINSSAGSRLAIMNDTIKFRVPFELTFNFYKNSNVSGTEVEAYDNEFQYAVIKLNPTGKHYSYTLESSSSLAWLDAVGNLFPYYKEVSTAKTAIISNDVFMWAKLNNGVAVIKVYENASYDLFTMSTNIYGGISPLYEFGKPIPTNAWEFSTKQAGDIRVSNETDTTYSVFISAWEVYKWNMAKNIAKIVFVLVIWAFIVLGLSFLLTAWLPAELAKSAFLVLLIVLGLATSPFLIMGIGAVI